MVFRSLSLNHWRNIVRNVTRKLSFELKSNGTHSEVVNKPQYLIIAADPLYQYENHKNEKGLQRKLGVLYPKRTLLSLVIRHLITYYLNIKIWNLMKTLKFLKQRIFSHFQDYLIQYISHQYQNLLNCNSPQYILSTYNSQHNNNNNVVLAMTMPYSGQGRELCLQPWPLYWHSHC